MIALSPSIHQPYIMLPVYMKDLLRNAAAAMIYCPPLIAHGMLVIIWVVGKCDLLPNLDVPNGSQAELDPDSGEGI